jgi:hypothetical protein
MMNTPWSLKQLAGVAVLSTVITGASHATTINFDSASTGAVEDTVADFKAYNTNGSDLVAEVSTDRAYSGNQSLKLVDNSTENKPFARREFASGAASVGAISVMVYVPSGNAKSSYFSVGTGKNNADRYFEVKISGSGIVQYENGGDDPEIGKISLDAWHELELWWAGGAFDVVIDGKTIIQSASILNADQTPTGITFYTGDKANAGNTTYIDDLTSDLF